MELEFLKIKGEIRGEYENINISIFAILIQELYLASYGITKKPKLKLELFLELRENNYVSLNPTLLPPPPQHHLPEEEEIAQGDVQSWLEKKKKKAQNTSNTGGSRE